LEKVAATDLNYMMPFVT